MIKFLALIVSSAIVIYAVNLYMTVPMIFTETEQFREFVDFVVSKAIHNENQI